jgi:hypothetical protein
MRLIRLVFVCLLLLLAAPVSAFAADRMWVGFQDDPSFRWREDRHAVISEAAETNASVLRTTVYWSRVAPRRPTLAASPTDPAYQWDDLDEFVRNAQARGMEVYLTIWGTPGWANLNKGPNVAPRKYADLQAFSRALATRYSGRIPGLPYVRFYSVWNEPNLEQFLAPTFDSKGRPVAQKTYAKLYRAAYSGLKGGSPTAQVAAGETSPRGRDRPSPGKIQDSMAPATFARLLSLQRPKIRFDAWAHHPYSVLGQGPNQKARYPNVHLTTIPIFVRDLRKWYGKSIELWISEYGFETKPAEPRGVSLAAQAVYAKQTIDKLRRNGYVKMLIWFIFRDDPTSTWQSGLETRDGARKPAFASFAAAADGVDARNVVIRAKVNQVPVVRIPTLELAARNGAGAIIGANVRIFGPNSVFYGTNQVQGVIGTDGWATFNGFPANGTKRTYYLFFEMNDKNGNVLKRTATLIID